MGQKFSSPELELYRKVDEVLFYVWDPIGVSFCPAARDEYQRYLPKVLALLQDDVGAPSVAAYLDDVATARMGLEARPEHSMRVAQLLLEWKTEIYRAQ
jgi:hypothetical protein